MSIKILHIIPNLRKGGAERLAIDIVTSLSKLDGVKVRLVILENEIAYDISAIQKHVFYINANVGLSITKPNQVEVDTLQQFIKDFQPDIIHSHLFKADVVSRSCFYPKAKWFSHCHDNMIQFKNASLETFTSKALFTNWYEKQYLLKRYKVNGGNKFIAISNNTKNYFENNGGDLNVFMLHNAIDYHRFYKKKLAGVHTPMRIINTGSFVDKKNQQFLLDIVSDLKSKGINTTLTLLGDGINKQLLLDKVKQLNISDVVFFKGNVESVENYLWDADIYVHSATYEPLGLVIIEAMAAGLPVVALDGGGNRDLMIDGYNGYILSEQITEQFVEKILKLYNEADLYNTISQNAQTHAAGFDINQYTENLLAIYKNAITNG